MTRFVGYIAMSLDGHIADANGGVDWLTQFNDPGNDFGYGDFYADVDVLVMGRATYDFVAVQPEWPYPDKHSYIVTSRPLDPRQSVEAVPPDFDALRARLVGQNLTVWIMGGGQTQRGALDAGMFDELRLFVMPIVLGNGPLVFADGPPTNATLINHKTWPGGAVELTYTF